MPKDTLNDFEQIKNFFDKNEIVLTTKILNKNGFCNQKIKKLLDSKIIEKLKRGYYHYLLSDYSYCEIPILTSLFPEGVLYLESALDYYDYTDRIPNAWHIALDRNKSRKQIEIQYPIVKLHFIKNFSLGITKIKVDGTEIKIYDKERTICDCIKNRNKMDYEQYCKSIKGYVNDKNKRIGVLAEYAFKLGIDKKVREILGPWL